MWCIGEEESRQWCLGRGIKLNGKGVPIADEDWQGDTFSLREAWPSLTGFSRMLATQLEPFDECLLWVTQWGVFPSSENLHLFYRMRNGYGENRQLFHAPGHLFLKHERADLATFIQLSVINCWDFYLAPAPSWKGAFVSHDEAVDFYADDVDADALKTVRAWFAKDSAPAPAP